MSCSRASPQACGASLPVRLDPSFNRLQRGFFASNLRTWRLRAATEPLGGASEVSYVRHM
eukprot:934462-Prymnesium_polylepis.1